MPQLYYKDYFSLKTLHKFGVSPEQNLDLSKSKEEILSPFGRLSKEDKTFLQGKVNAALIDNGIVKEEAKNQNREPIFIAELEENVFENTPKTPTPNAPEIASPVKEQEGKNL